VIGSLALAALLAGGAASPAPAAGIRWERRFDEALRKARLAHKALLVDFWADWCTWCHKLDASTYIDPVVVRLAEDYVPVKVDTEGSSKEASIALRYDVSSLPTIAFISPAGRQILRLNGYQGPGQFPRTLQAAKLAADKVIAWEDALERNPKDPVALAELGLQQFDQEVYDESKALLYKALKQDAARPGEERKRTRMLLAILEKYDRRWAEAEQLCKQGLAVQPASEYDPKLLFVLGKIYVSWGRQGEARAVFENIVNHYPGSPVTEKARDVLAEMRN
jgi:thioredoxin 1